MGDKTFNHIEIKSKMTSRHFTLYKTTTVLPLHQQGLVLYAVYIMTTYSNGHKYEVLQIQRQHTLYTHKTNNPKIIIKEKHMH